MVGTLVLVCAVNQWVILISVPLSIVFFFLRTYYLKSAREIKRIESINRSPIYSHFSSSLAGAPVIRSLGAARVSWMAEVVGPVSVSLSSPLVLCTCADGC
jgi:ATP-binding cassette subfamily C (CFTR/MRP) protein 4